MIRVLSFISIFALFFAFTTQQTALNHTAGHNFSAFGSKMNVLYLGAPNTVQVTACDVAGSEIELLFEDNIIEPMSAGKYSITPRKVGQTTLNLRKKGEDIATPIDFRVKRIPDPVATLGGRQRSSMGSGEFKAQSGIMAMLQDFDFDVKCTVNGFETIRISKDGGREQQINTDARFTTESQTLIGKAMSGDIYLFRNIKSKCPGDAVARTLNDISFEIK